VLLWYATVWFGCPCPLVETVLVFGLPGPAPCLSRSGQQERGVWSSMCTVFACIPRIVFWVWLVMSQGVLTFAGLLLHMHMQLPTPWTVTPTACC
jgi:hypothetical protein